MHSHNPNIVDVTSNITVALASEITAAAITLSGGPRAVYIQIDDAECVGFPAGQMPQDHDDVLEVLRAETAPFHIWLECAVEYYKVGNDTAFLSILGSDGGATDPEAKLHLMNLTRNDAEKLALRRDLIAIYMALATYHMCHALSHASQAAILYASAIVRDIGNPNEDASAFLNIAEILRERGSCLDKATEYLNAAEEISHETPMSWVAKGFFVLTESALSIGLNEWASGSGSTDDDRRRARSRHPQGAATSVLGLGLTGVSGMAHAPCDWTRVSGHFSNALIYDSNYLPAILGKALVCYHLGQYANAIDYYKTALGKNPVAPAHIRLGLALCCAQLEACSHNQGHNNGSSNGMSLSSLAFTRVLQLQPNNVTALCGLAVSELNMASQAREERRLRRSNLSKQSGDCDGDRNLLQAAVDSVDCEWRTHQSRALRLLKRAYEIDSSNPTVLVNLASQLFWSGVSSVRQADKDSSNSASINSMLMTNNACVTKARVLAQTARLLTTSLEVSATACFVLAQIFHSQSDLENAHKEYLAAVTAIEDLISRRATVVETASEAIQKGAEKEGMEAFASLSYTTALGRHGIVLAKFGLGQTYIARREWQKAAECFSAVLVAYPHNYETNRVLGALYASPELNRYEDARRCLEKATQAQPDDADAFAELGQLCQVTDPPFALEAYQSAIRLKKKLMNSLSSSSIAHCETEVFVAEMMNNTGLLYHKANDFTQASTAYRRSLQTLQQVFDRINGSNAILELNTSSLKTMIDAVQSFVKFNQARLSEDNGDVLGAMNIYEALCRQKIYSIDCMLRLSICCRRVGRIKAAQEWLGEAIAENPNNADAWCMLGSLLCNQREWGRGQRLFERVLHLSSTGNTKVSMQDSYALLSMGNIWLSTAYSKPEKSEVYLHRALDYYIKVLRRENDNIFAANGIGAVLAEMGKTLAAKDVFMSVREAVAKQTSTISTESLNVIDSSSVYGPSDEMEAPDVLLNFAHMLLELKQFVSAIKLYEKLSRSLYSNSNKDIWLYLAKAHWKASWEFVSSIVTSSTGTSASASSLYIQRMDSLKQCRVALERALHLCPTDTILSFNLALVIQTKAEAVVSRWQDVKSATIMKLKSRGCDSTNVDVQAAETAIGLIPLAEIEGIVFDLRTASRVFRYLSNSVSLTAAQANSGRLFVPHEPKIARRHSDACTVLSRELVPLFSEAKTAHDSVDYARSERRRRDEESTAKQEAIRLATIAAAEKELKRQEEIADELHRRAQQIGASAMAAAAAAEQESDEDENVKKNSKKRKKEGFKNESDDGVESDEDKGAYHDHDIDNNNKKKSLSDNASPQDWQVRRDSKRRDKQLLLEGETNNNETKSMSNDDNDDDADILDTNEMDVDVNVDFTTKDDLPTGRFRLMKKSRNNGDDGNDSNENEFDDLVDDIDGQEPPNRTMLLNPDQS